MNTTFSPFLSDIQECRQTMRKLRKKIYKNCRNNQYPLKKLKDNTEDIIQIFQKRNIPAFVTQTLRKRRNFDLKSIKNILVTSFIPLQEIQNRTYLQEKQVESIYSQHKKRLQELKKKQEENKVLGEVMYQLSTDNIYSSTNEDQYIRSMEAQMIEISHSESQQGINILYDDGSPQEREPICHKDYFDFNINESSMHQDLAFLNF